jgi:hypothetical protein
MTEETTYYRPTKLDYLYDAATSIDDEVKLPQVIFRNDYELLSK